MNVSLTPALQQFLKRRIKAGRFENTNDAIHEAISLLKRRDELAAQLRPNFHAIGSIAGEDVMALAFIVMMESARSARDDLREIMQGVQAINATKAALRDLIAKMNQDIAENLGQRNGKPPLKFRGRGIGSETGYHRMPVPHTAPGTPGGVRFVPTNMYAGRIGDVSVLRAIQDNLKGQLDSASELGETESLRLQMAMDRVSKFRDALSNILKKMSDTDSKIIANMK